MNQRTLEYNVSERERLVSVLSGSVLLWKQISGRKNFNILKLLTAGYLVYRGISGNCPAYTAMGKPKVANPVKNLNIRISLLINKPVKEVYAYWRNLENLPAFISHLESVKNINENLSRWTAVIPGHLGKIEWEARIVKEEENRIIAWQSLAESKIQNAGKVTFEPAGRKSTEMSVYITYHAPLGAAGNLFFKLLNPQFEKILDADIRNFKAHFERL
jgi:uncharacterized membrane protein